MKYEGFGVGLMFVREQLLLRKVVKPKFDLILLDSLLLLWFSQEKPKQINR